MDSIELRSWVLEELDRFTKGSRHEDSFVEFKAKWPSDHRKAARQIAGLGNAARGSPALWIIGVHTKDGVVGAEDLELSTWWRQVQRHFDGQPPLMQSAVVTLGDEPPVVGLLFVTDQRPFVVKEESGDYEVPWRDGTGTRTASQAELISLLSPLQKVPRFDLRRLTTIAFQPNPDEGRREWRVSLNGYVYPEIGQQVTFVRHRMLGILHVPEYRMTVEVKEGSWVQQRVAHSIVTFTEPSFVSFSGSAYVPESNVHARSLALAPEEDIEIDLRFWIPEVESPLIIRETLKRTPSSDSSHWGHWQSVPVWQP